jgi:hypothetical protein
VGSPGIPQDPHGQMQHSEWGGRGDVTVSRKRTLMKSVTTRLSSLRKRESVPPARSCSFTAPGKKRESIGTISCSTCHIPIFGTIGIQIRVRVRIRRDEAREARAAKVAGVEA